MPQYRTGNRLAVWQGRKLMYDIIEKTNETICSEVASNIKLEGWPAAVAILGLGAMQLAKVLLESRTEKKEV